MPRLPLAKRRTRRLSIAVAAAMLAVPAAIALASADPPKEAAISAAAPAPETAIVSGPSGPTAGASPSFAFSSPLAQARFDCRLDSAAFEPCESPHTFTDLPDGAHTFYVGARARRPDPSPASRTFVVDTEAPAVAVDSGQSGPTNDPLPAFAFSSPDPSATFACSIAAEAPNLGPCLDAGADRPASELPDGAYTFSVEAMDPAGNSTTATRAFTVDTEAPAVSVDSGPSGPADDPRPTFGFSSPDPAATFACSIDTGDPELGPCSGARTDRPDSDLSEGSYTFRAEATDAAGNSTIATRDFALGEDGTASRSKRAGTRWAPRPVPAWYMTARSKRDLRRQARNDACAFARRQSNRTRVLLLDFGKANKRGGEFGAQLRTGPHFSNQNILGAMKAAADSYRSTGRCYSRGSVRITYGNTNNMRTKMHRRKVRKAGRRQAMMANRLAKYQRRHGRAYRFQGVAVAGDLEPQWNRPALTKDLVHGATHRGRGGLYFNYGAATNCPPEKSVCANRWSLREIGQVSYGGVKRPLPEIYRLVHVKQWTKVRRRWNNQHRDGHFCFYGATATPGFPLSTRKGWRRLRANNRCVHAELVNIQEQ